MATARVWLILIGLVLAVGCYYLPWYTHETAGFTTNAFDLAEWTSVHPAVRSSSPPMLTSFLLRFPHLMLGCALALAANWLRDPRARWIIRGLTLLLALRFFPPSDFFSSATDDPNYRQMMLLTVLGVGSILATITLARIPGWLHGGLLIAALVSSQVSGWWGLSRAGILLDNFEIDVSIGPGIIGLSLVSFLLVLGLVWPSRARPLRRSRAGYAVQRAV